MILNILSFVISLCVLAFVVVQSLADKHITPDEVAAFKGAAMKAVIEAQNLFGEGTGKLKLQFVTANLAEKFPRVYDFLGEEVVEELIGKAKKALVNLANDNDTIAAVLDVTLEDK